MEGIWTFTVALSRFGLASLVESCITVFGDTISGSHPDKNLEQASQNIDKLDLHMASEAD